MTWRGGGAVALVVAVTAALCACASAKGAGADSPPDARLLVSRWKLPDRFELFTVDGSGGASETLFSSSAKKPPVPLWSSPPAWSPDGTQVALTLVTRRSGEFARRLPTKLALVPAEGGEPEPLRGTYGGFAPVFSSDGGRIAFTKKRRRRKRNRHGGNDLVYESASVWMLDLATGSTAQLTPWRNRQYQSPSSFSPDGTQLAVTRVVGDRPPEAIAMGLDGSVATILAQHALEPVYSPDGKSIAFLRGPVRTRVKKNRRGETVGTTTATLTNLYVKSTGGGGLRRLTRTKNAVELSPRWDPSGQRLAYTKVSPFRSESAFLGFGDAVMEINADGTCPTTILSTPRAAHYAGAWQPGPGREAGPIAC